MWNPSKPSKRRKVSMLYDIRCATQIIVPGSFEEQESIKFVVLDEKG
jgi:hypothetical protein